MAAAASYRPFRSLTLPNHRHHAVRQPQNCNVIVSRCVRREDGTGYDVYYEPKLVNFPIGDDLADATLINQLVEQAVLKAPEQYLWVHRRFKTRPQEDMPSYYS